MTFWWASQSRNYKTVIPAGTLWTRPRISTVVPTDRRVIKDMEVDDIVFHYGKGSIRAVSRVVAPWVPAIRPEGYRRGPREDETNDDGWLVQVEAFATDLALPHQDISSLIRWGDGGPLTQYGLPHEKYLSLLTDDEGRALLGALDVLQPTKALPGRPHEDWVAGTAETDRIAASTMRVEQSALRARLLGGFDEAICGLCGRHLPADLLVAAHIVPRSRLSNEERHNFFAVAVLMCILGCDALHEHRYTHVNNLGTIQASRPLASSAIGSHVAMLVGRSAPGWNDLTAPYFAQHAALADA